MEIENSNEKNDYESLIKSIKLEKNIIFEQYKHIIKINNMINTNKKKKEIKTATENSKEKKIFSDLIFENTKKLMNELSIYNPELCEEKISEIDDYQKNFGLEIPKFCQIKKKSEEKKNILNLEYFKKNFDFIMKDDKNFVILEFEKQEIKNGDLNRLQPSEWLNDSLMNFFIVILKNEIFLKNSKVFFDKSLEINDFCIFKTFFSFTITNWILRKNEILDIEQDYENKILVFKKELSKKINWIWKKNKIDIFSNNYLFIPFHRKNHWNLFVIKNLKNFFDELLMKIEIIEETQQKLKNFEIYEDEKKNKNPEKTESQPQKILKPENLLENLEKELKNKIPKKIFEKKEPEKIPKLENKNQFEKIPKLENENLYKNIEIENKISFLCLDSMNDLVNPDIYDKTIVNSIMDIINIITIGTLKIKNNIKISLKNNLIKNNVVVKQVQVPKQNNLVDCGIAVLENIENFILKSNCNHFFDFENHMIFYSGNIFQEKRKLIVKMIIDIFGGKDLGDVFKEYFSKKVEFVNNNGINY